MHTDSPFSIKSTYRKHSMRVFYNGQCTKRQYRKHSACIVIIIINQIKCSFHPTIAIAKCHYDVLTTLYRWNITYRKTLSYSSIFFINKSGTVFTKINQGHQVPPNGEQLYVDVTNFPLAPSPHLHPSPPPRHPSLFSPSFLLERDEQVVWLMVSNASMFVLPVYFFYGVVSMEVRVHRCPWLFATSKNLQKRCQHWW